MPSVDVVDETFLAVPPVAVAAQLPGWPDLWPDLRIEVMTDRGEKGVRWTVTGALDGSMEVWLEPVLDGTVLHFFLRAEPATPTSARRAAAEAARRHRAAKAIALAWKERLEEGREPGEAPQNP